jgi:glycosyltransferase involved in cell wall biosynthesis
MRIVYFYQYFTTPRGCWSTRVYEMTRRWVEAGDQVTVVTTVYDKSDLRPSRWLERLDIDGIDVRVVNLRLSNKHGRSLRILTFLAYAGISCWYALTLKADVVVASSGPLTVGLPGLVARHLRGRRFVFEVRDLWPEGAIQLGLLRNRLLIPIARWFERRCYRSAHAIVALSDGIAEDIQQRWGFQHTHVVPNAADNALFGGPLEFVPSIDDGVTLVVYTGTLGLIDDCGQILRMAECLQRRGITGIEIALVGDGKERPLLERYAADTGLRNVRFVGSRPKNEVVGWLRSARCALMPVRPVPFLDTASPNKLFDAFAAGVPVVQTTQGWIKQLLQREACGITVPPNDPDAMADAVLRLIGDPAFHQAVSDNARRVALTLFDRDLLSARMREVLVGGAAA